MTTDGERLMRVLAVMIAEASDGEVSAEEALAGGHSLSALGLTSLARIRLIDTIEDTFGVDVDLGGDLSSAEHVSTLATSIAASLSAPPAEELPTAPAGRDGRP
ncbi:acyl carrier protein [Nonomuraea sp. NPDC002799]